MSETIITVRGEHVDRHPAEEGVATVRVAFDGPSRDDVVARATRATGGLRQGLTDRPGVTEFAIDQTRIWSDRPWNNEGRQLDPVFHAEFGLRATFADAEALSAWLDAISTADGIQVQGVAWQLTPARLAEAQAEARAAAVADAVGKAQAYAAALGLGEVAPVALADPGLLGDATPKGPSPKMMRASFAASDATGGIQLTPGGIEVAAVVEARFRAS